jgi:membrane-associated protease RseP (regulator of RpoE activity)
VTAAASAEPPWYAGPEERSPVPFWSRRTPEPPPAWEELFPLEALLRNQLEDVLVVQERRIMGRSLAFGGRLLVEPARALERLRPRLALHGYTPFIRDEGGVTWIQTLPLVQAGRPARMWLHVTLFLATVLTTLVAGAVEGGVPLSELPRDPARLLVGWPFSATLLTILGVHEFGHYAVGRHHGMPVSLPYFIPLPPPFLLGTMGAVIRLEGPVPGRKALFDMAIAGPLAGLLIAVPAYVVGIGWSRVVSAAEMVARAGDEPLLGPSILSVLLHRLVLGPMPPDGVGIALHPVATAAWFGFFVTALNLIPAGQLDGGHVVYALFGNRHGLISRLAVGLLVFLGLVFGSINWLVWAALIVGVMGFHHSPTMDDITPLDGRRRALGLFALVLLLMLLPPVPLSMR